MAMQETDDKKISIHAPLRERLNFFVKYGLLTKISIHAPLRERLSFLR